MRRILHLIIYRAICGVWLLMMGMLTSCSDSSDSQENSAAEEELTAEQQQAFKQLLAVKNVLTNLAGVEELSEDFASKTYPPIYGKVLDESKSFVRAMKADDQERALELFEMIVEQDDLLSQTSDGYSVELRLPDKVAQQGKTSFGKLTYHESKDPSRVAYVDVEMPNIPNLQRIDFVPSQLWGDNSGEATAFKLGEVARYNGFCWLCVRENDGPDPGVLVRLDVNANEQLSTWMEKEKNPSTGGWKLSYPSTREDVKSYLTFLDNYAYALQLDREYIKKHFPQEADGFCPIGFKDADGYLYKRDKPAAIIMKGYMGSYVWYAWYHNRHCDYYTFPQESKDGKGEFRSFVYIRNKTWEKEMWNPYYLYSLSAIHFGGTAPSGVTSLYDPAVELSARRLRQ